MSLPDGVVTFLFTDVEGSTRLWEEASEVMMRALAQHDEVIDAAVEAHNGVSVKPRGEGDSRFVVFPAAIDALNAAAAIQTDLTQVNWVTSRSIRVRMALHTGHAELQLGDYYGPAVNRAARLRSIAHGGQTIMSEATWQLVQDHLPEGVTVVDMGRHGLKDLSRPEHVYQLNVRDLPTDFPPLKSLDAVPNNLPIQPTKLIGRERESEEIDRLLTHTRLLTILAPGGTGKTRLAIQVAADHISDYPDGVYFVSLADIDIAHDIAPAVAATLGITLVSGRNPESQLFDYLTARRTLLVFDNCEHLAAGAGMIATLLLGAPDVTIIATSRTLLNVTGETTYALGGLDIGRDAPERAIQAAGTQLFLEAARRSRPDISLHDDDYAPLAEIMELTQGVPLAILLAAAWSNVLSMSEIANEIRKNLDILESDAEDMPDRHRSIRAVFDYTWNLLSPEESDLFAALSVFRGGFTREAAEVVAGARLRDLAGLTKKSLITPDPDTGRYRVHELLRQYAQAELQKSPETHSSVSSEHARYYADQTWAAFSSVFEDEAQALETIEEDFDNLRLAWRYSVGGNQAGWILRMLGGLWFFTEVRGWYPVGLDLFAAAVAGLEESPDEQAIIARASATAFHSAYSALLGRQPEQAAEAAAHAVQDLRGVADPLTILLALNQHGVCLIYLRRFDDFIAAYDEAQEVWEASPDPYAPTVPIVAAGFKVARAFVALMSGDPELAKRLLEESRHTLEPLGELYYMSWNLAHRARAALAEGRPGDAIVLFLQSADRARQIGFNRGLEYTLSELGDIQLANGDLLDAERSLLEALATAEKTNMSINMLGGLVKIATVFASTEREVKAVELLSSVLADKASVGQQLGAGAPINDLAGNQLEALRAKVDPEEYEVARVSGASKTHRTLVKELVDDWLGHPGVVQASPH
jgi:predicted ATPase/class 3 adenylate cyclase